MTPEEAKVVLYAHEGKRLRITFIDGTTQNVDIHSADDEGFLHSGPDGEKPAAFWTRFDAVKQIDTIE